MEARVGSRVPVEIKEKASKNWQLMVYQFQASFV